MNSLKTTPYWPGSLLEGQQTAAIVWANSWVVKVILEFVRVRFSKELVDVDEVGGKWPNMRRNLMTLLYGERHVR